MPNHKHHRTHRGRDDDNNNNQNVQFEAINNNRAANGGQQRNDDPRSHLFACCFPSGCRNVDEMVDSHDPGDAVKVFCNNESCLVGKWMHKDCFEEWEQSVLAYLRSCGRARSWSEKQRLQNLWTKKGYDLAFKACDCKCGRGHMRKDLDYIPSTPHVDNAKKSKKHKKKNDKPLPVVSTSHKTSNHSQASVNQNSNVINNNTNLQNNHSSGPNNNHNSNHVNPTGQPREHPPLQLRLRTSSVSSTGSSPPNSAASGSPLSSSPVNTNFIFKQNKKMEYFADAAQAAAGNIFKRRQDYSAFHILPRFKQNPYNIKMEDEGPYGNDDTRSFVLSTLSTYKMTSLRCVLCKCNLAVFDHYPLIDGTFFLSPQAYDDGVVQVIWEGRIQFLNSVCVRCIEGKTDIKCASCKCKWDGSTFVLGTMYTYDIFAAMPCCQKRLTCKYCRRAVVDVTSGLNFYSQYSQMIICPYCKANDYHFIRSMGETFVVKEPICC